ncbi:MAG: DUF3305 domain-containing protein [Pseudomonadota bacterium]
MPNELSIPLGVIVSKERTSNPWQDYRWRPVSVFFDAPPNAGWSEVRRGPGFVHYHAATLILSLVRSETMAYRVNLANGEPSLYVVLKDGSGANHAVASPIDVHMLTASPFEAQNHGDLGFDIIEAVRMPDRLIGIVENFIAAHHAGDDEYKRKRNGSMIPMDRPQFPEDTLTDGLLGSLNTTSARLDGDVSDFETVAHSDQPQSETPRR